MKKLHLYASIAALLALATNNNQAAQPNEEISVSRARELGIVLKSKPDGENGIKVWLEFEPTGVLKNFTQVDLEIGAPGKRAVVAPLMTSTSRPAPEKVTTYFSADLEMLTTSVLTILVQPPDHERIGLRIQVKDFVNLSQKKTVQARPAPPQGLRVISLSN